MDLFSEADIVVQGEISYDTTYIDGKWAYTSYIIEPCTSLKDSQGSRSKPLAITRMGGVVDGTHYSRPHGLYIFGGEQALFFLKLVADDEITPESFTSVVPISYDNGFTKYLTDDWKPVVPIEDSLYSAGDFRSTVNEILAFEYCSDFESKYVIAPELSFNDESVSLAFGFGYESHNQLPAAPASLEIHFGEPVAQDLVNEVSVSLSEGVEYSLEAINPTTWSLSIEVDSFDFYLEDLVQVAQISLPAALISQLGSVEVTKSGAPTQDGKSSFSRIVYEEEIPKSEGFKTPRISSTTAEVVGGIRRAVDLAGSIGSQRLGIACIIGSDFGNYTQTELRQLVPTDLRIEMRRESSNPSNSETISPLADDIITWTDELIEFYVPTLGYIDGGTISARSGAFDSRINLVTSDGNDRSPNTTRVFYNQRSNTSVVQARFGFSTDDISIRKQWLENRNLTDESTERGLTFVYDPSFVTALRIPSDLAEAKRDVCDASAEWTRLTGIPIDIVDECPEGVDCSIIEGDNITSTTTNTLALASGLSAVPVVPACAPEEPRTYDTRLTFNNTLQDKFVSRSLSPTGGGSRVVYTQALHEFGHILQMNHVADNNELMRVLAGTNSTLTSAAIAGGTHVRNVSLTIPTSCNNIMQFSTIPTECSTSSLVEVEDMQETYELSYLASSHQLRILKLGTDGLSYRLLVMLHGSDGRTILRKQMQATSQDINLPNMAAGLYTFSLIDRAGNVHTLSFVKS